MKKIILISLIVALIGAIGIYGGIQYWQDQQVVKLYEKARSALEKSDFQKARVYSERALRFRPDRSSLLLVYSESVFKDPTIDAERRVKLAIEALGRIPDSADEALKARTSQASILFFDQLQASKAEEELKRAIEIAPDEIEPIRSLMQIYCCTGRATFTEPLFKRMIELAESSGEKRTILTAWFLSQFAESTFNSATDQMLRVDSLFESEIPVSQKRLLAFRNADPDSQAPKVALAHWFYLRSDGKQAKILLDEMDPELLDLTDPLYLVTAVNVYLECGEIELAEELHEMWSDKNYFEYWRQKGVLEQDYQNDREAAAKSLEQALTIWPGHVDPSVYFRLENLYQLMNDPEKSKEYKSLGEKMRNVTDVERIKELQNAILQPALTKKNCLQFEQFYLALRRKYEAACWRELSELID